MQSQYMTEASPLCRMIERGSHKCDERRRARILTYAPTFGRHGSKAYLDRLVKQAVEGNAWHAGGLLSLLTPHAWYTIAHQVVRAAHRHTLCVPDCQRACRRRRCACWHHLHCKTLLISSHAHSLCEHDTQQLPFQLVAAALRVCA